MKTGKSENVDGTWSNTYTPLKMDNFAYKSNDVRVYQLCKSASSQNEQQIIVVYKYTEMISMNLMELVSNSVRRLNDEIMLLFSGMKTRKVKIWTTRSTTKERRCGDISRKIKIERTTTSTDLAQMIIYQAVHS
ncbi:hypothetical protein T4C_10509 [Trichinella pseudospiralis]|uniref:Uncharacterized protein n=1 Tax=Trichinella pseudospiralis TaxID=6337 RepID=A0A0V1JSL5_TRIPS|nr:hypothetical protein T4C_10509 [Trichinella pseudospiralis]